MVKPQCSSTVEEVGEKGSRRERERGDRTVRQRVQSEKNEALIR